MSRERAMILLEEYMPDEALRASVLDIAEENQGELPETREDALECLETIEYFVATRHPDYGTIEDYTGLELCSHIKSLGIRYDFNALCIAEELPLLDSLWIWVDAPDFCEISGYEFTGFSKKLDVLSIVINADVPSVSVSDLAALRNMSIYFNYKVSNMSLQVTDCPSLRSIGGDLPEEPTDCRGTVLCPLFTNLPECYSIQVLTWFEFCDSKIMFDNTPALNELELPEELGPDGFVDLFLIETQEQAEEIVANSTQRVGNHWSRDENYNAVFIMPDERKARKDPNTGECVYISN